MAKVPKGIKKKERYRDTSSYRASKQPPFGPPFCPVDDDPPRVSFSHLLSLFFLALFRLKKKISLLILDETMPKIKGLDVLKEVRRSRPDIKAIVMSGYEIEEKGDPFTIFLQKPLKVESLLEAVENLLKEHKMV